MFIYLFIIIKNQEFCQTWEDGQSKRATWHAKWRQEAQTIRTKLEMNCDFEPWTRRPALKLHGIPRTPRVLECLNVKYWKMRLDMAGTAEEGVVEGKFVDVSQSMFRTCKGKTAKTGLLPVYTSSSQIYSFQHDILVTGGAQLASIGWAPEMFDLGSFSDNDCRNLSGDSFSVPWACLIQRALLSNPYAPWWFE